MNWIEDRPESYDPELIWDPDTQTWITPNKLEIKNILVVVGHDENGLGTIYFGDI
jgi:hypothetical protein